MKNFQLTQQQVDQYHRDGYLIVKHFLSDEEIKKLYDIAMADDTARKHAFDLNDQTGKKQNFLSGTPRAMMHMGC